MPRARPRAVSPAEPFGGYDICPDAGKKKTPTTTSPAEMSSAGKRTTCTRPVGSGTTRPTVTSGVTPATAPVVEAGPEQDPSSPPPLPLLELLLESSTKHSSRQASHAQSSSASGAGWSSQLGGNAPSVSV
ncbi:hypothetical protein WME99_29360 [Sorangium sp. So ce136]|uniref:hypothetical protein n=1 Tax=Sorangium sp. So ce136 TaxID=3133284 RepID=UPI003F1256F3